MATWYNEERVKQPGSVILKAFVASREAARAVAQQAARQVSTPPPARLRGNGTITGRSHAIFPLGIATSTPQTGCDEGRRPFVEEVLSALRDTGKLTLTLTAADESDLARALGDLRPAWSSESVRRLASHIGAGHLRDGWKPTLVSLRGRDGRWQMLATLHDESQVCPKCDPTKDFTAHSRGARCGIIEAAPPSGFEHVRLARELGYAWPGHDPGSESSDAAFLRITGMTVPDARMHLKSANRSLERPK